MGCDIHAHIEVKIDGVWHHYHAPAIPRDYPLFARLAGIRARDPLDRKYPARSLPEDISVITRMHFEKHQSILHDLSWLNSKELAEVHYWYEDVKREQGAEMPYVFSVFGYLFDDGYDVSYRNRNSRIEDCRMIFWFDN